MADSTRSGSQDALLSVRNLKKYYRIQAGSRIAGREAVYLRAVDDVSFDLFRGETLGVVGESGCGKSTTGKCIMRIEDPTEGEIFLDGIAVHKLSEKRLQGLRKRIQMVFQDPYSSLNPRKKIWRIVAEPLEISGEFTRDECRSRACELLERVGLKAELADRYPHQFSGGQRQRIGIARSLALEPDIIVLDEPVSALDVSIQAAVINLLQDLQKEFKLSYLFISHDLAVVRHMCDRVAVMYLGQIVESAPVEDLFTRFIHPYTQALLDAVPDPDPNANRSHAILEGDVPNPADIQPGCRFKTRCPQRAPECDEFQPLYMLEGGHLCRCRLAADKAIGVVDAPKGIAYKLPALDEEPDFPEI